MISHKEALEVIRYDPATGECFFLKRKGPRIAGRKAGSKNRGDGYIYIKIDNVRYALHRLIWFYVTGKWPEEDIDHINHVRDDNRWCNLREATRSQNLISSIKPLKNKHGIKGVVTYGDRFRARLWVNKKCLHLGIFATAEEAGEAYTSALKKHFGEYAPC